jgi:capsule polysaccharide export protein KpsE/RkpR
VEVKNEMDSARGELEDFQMKYKAVDFDEQTRLAIEQAANLKISLSEIEFQLKLNEISLGKDNAELVELKSKKKIIKQQLFNLENENSDSSFFSLPVASIPAIKGQYELLFSRVKVAEGLYQVLLNQQEQIKMKELEKMPTITVLDRATPPELKSRPKKSYIIISAFILSLMFSFFLAVVLGYFERMEKEKPEDYKRAIYFMYAFFGWLPGVKKVNK